MFLQDIIQSMPHDAHPMGVLVSAMSALSIFHPDANPALSGQDIYKSKQVRDKQIVRILGKVLFYLLMICFLNVSVYKLRD
jgi:citrate synthase